MIQVLYRFRTIDPSQYLDVDKHVITRDNNDEIMGVILDARPFDAEQYKNLKVISRIGVGKDNIDLDYCKKKGIKVYITPCKELTDSVAEFALMQTLKFYRERTGGQNISDKSIGIIGYGRIGRRIAEIAPLTMTPW